MLDLIKVIVLGIVEGITEFLPISSTGHLIVATALLRPNFSPAMSKTFEIFIQVGAIVAVVVFYRAELWRQVTTVRTDRRVLHFWLALLIAFVPIGAVGFLLRDFIDEHLQDSPPLVAASLIVGGVLFIIIERYLSRRDAAAATASASNAPAGDDQLYAVSFQQALLIGVIQIIALVPGVSRAAASIFAGMLGGLKRETATRFSFYLSIPTLGTATLFKLIISLGGLSGSDLIFLVVGAIISGIVAWFAIGWLLRYIAHHTFTGFGYYRIAAGVVILLLGAAALL